MQKDVTESLVGLSACLLPGGTDVKQKKGPQNSQCFSRNSNLAPSEYDAKEFASTPRILWKWNLKD
jgi:hypothetical protein